MKNDDAGAKREVRKNRAGGDFKYVVVVVSGLVLCLLGVVVVMFFTNPNAYKNLKSKDTKLEKEARYISGALPVLRQGVDVKSPRPCLTKQCVETSSYILNKMDFSVNPCDDMYFYSCGGLHAKTKIPRTKTFGVYQEADNRLHLRLQKILSSNDTELFGKNSSAVAKMKMFYQMCMDEKALREKKTSRVLSVISDLGSWTLSNVGIVPFDKRKWSLQATLTKLHKMGFNLLFSLELLETQNPETYELMKILYFQPYDPTTYMSLYVGGPYFRNHVIDSIMRKAHKLGGSPSNIQSKAEAILNFFNSLVFEQDLVEPEPIPIGKLQQKIGSLLDVKQYVSEMFGVDLGSNEIPMFCTDTGYFDSLGKAFKQFDSEVLANVLMINFLEEIRDYLPASFRTPTTHTREDFCTAQIHLFFLPPMYALHVRDYLTPETKSKVFVMGENIKKQIVNTFDGVPWFGEQLKATIIRKAQTMKLLIGYPDWIVDPATLDKIYHNVKVHPGELLFSVLSIKTETLRQKNQQMHREPSIGALEQLNKIREFYLPTENTVNIASSVLQLPSFSLHFPTSMQYGGIGETLGHEIMHAFDDVRITYTANFKPEPSWNSAANESFMKGARCLIDHYMSVPFDTIRANGLSSISEDICDNEGIKLAYKAYKALGELNEPRLPGLNLTDDQMFFLGSSQKYCTLDLNDEPYATPSHNHGRVRVRAVASNSEEFAKAFNCPKNSPMNSAKKCTIF
ncbi:unnamed protein product [Lymnaea stagnalis]|uniref:Uncharacterized protein n=1 Tax=Lymnaea stagnalis TaxID=6523 RepID=A0AAV2ILV3_LYMST